MAAAVLDGISTRYEVLGSGPSLFALCRGSDVARHVARAMTAAVRRHIGGEPQTYVSPIAAEGARVIPPCAS